MTLEIAGSAALMPVKAQVMVASGGEEAVALAQAQCPAFLRQLLDIPASPAKV
ncbi:MAG: hypothetical protein LC126_07030 [Bryobacterales bacterium]|nr:hypothetical protein [Bryobacterales bacterium]